MRRITVLMLSALIVFSLSACTEGQEQNESLPEEPVSSSQPDVSPPEPVVELWIPEEATPGEALTAYQIDDTAVEYQVVEVQRTKLFSLELDGLSNANWYLIDGNVVIDYQQENIVVLDWSGGELARLPSTGMGVAFSEKHFSMVDYDAKTITIYSGMSGEETASISIADVPGTVQGVSVSDDGAHVAFTSDTMESGLALYRGDALSGEVTELTPELPDGMGIGYGVQHMAAGSVLAVDAYGEETPHVIYLDEATGALQLTVDVPEPILDEEDNYIFPRALHTQSGLIYYMENESALQLVSPFVWGERLNSLYRTQDCGGIWMQHLPLTGQGRAGFFPIYDFITIGALDDDNVLVAYFNSGLYQIEQITLTNRLISTPQGGIDLSQEGLDAILGQQLYHRFGGGTGDTYRLISSIVCQYVDAFAPDYVLDSEDPELADSLYSFVLFNNYGIEGGLLVRLEDYYDDDTGIYSIPADVVEQWVAGTFQIEGLEVDLRTAAAYDADTDSFTYGPGYGFGDTDIVYLTSAYYTDDMLYLQAAVHPSPLSDQKDRLDQEWVQFVVQYDQDADTFAYRSVERIR